MLFVSKLCHFSILTQLGGTVFRQQAAEEAQSAARLDKEGCMEYNVTEITVINTHCHGDHTSGNRQFTRFVMSREDLDAIRPSCPDGAWIRTVTDGEEITAGSACVKVLAIPGHTPGSIALLDEKDRLLFSSDAVAKHFPDYMQFPGQDVGKYLESLKKMKALRGRYDRICPCHGELDVEPVYLDKMIRCCEGILDGTIRPGTALNSAGTVERAFWIEDVAVFH